MLNAVLIVWHVLNDFFKKGKRAWENDICKIRTNKKKGEAHTFAMSSPFTGSSIICSQASGFFVFFMPARAISWRHIRAVWWAAQSTCSTYFTRPLFLFFWEMKPIITLSPNENRVSSALSHSGWEIRPAWDQFIIQYCRVSVRT